MPQSNSDTRSYHRLNIQDLLQAQQIFHSDLSSRENVVATAVGLYRKRREGQRRTLTNSWIDKEGREPSWPCVLVFVKSWEERDAIRSRNDDGVVPGYVTLPDRRRVPTCVICVDEASAPPPPLFQRLNFPTWMMGGGFPVLRYAQEEDRAGSIGCLVSDGANVFALTNRHVTGSPGDLIETFVRGERIRIGVSSGKQVGKVSIDDAFPGFQVSEGWTMPVTYTNLDAGLILVDDVNAWTAQLFGVGELAPLYDLSADTISLDLIGEKVSAFGAASGKLEGEIQGLFYRYKTVGSYGYVSDLLIGPRGAKPMKTIPGDSGTIWCLDEKPEQGSRARRLRPIAMQWGGHVFANSGEHRYQVALATSLSTILRSLEIDIISDWNTGHSEYWGKVGHYKVAATACSLANPNTAFGEFIRDNAENIAFGDADISKGEVTPAKGAFCPLADVADLVWRNTRKKDSANHFADMDEEGKGKYAGTNLLEMTKGGKNIDAAVWIDFYKELGTKTQHMGALPFRVWQMFDEAVDHLKKGDIDKYLAAMGLMAHYVGDACQPLHVSHLHHGRNEKESKVHSIYETNMLDRNTLAVVQKINAIKLDPLPAVNNGHEAARAVIELMRRTFKTLPPVEVLDVFNEKEGKERLINMWKQLGDRTAQCMADGARTLLMIWQSAWNMGSGNKVPASKRKKISEKRLTTLYNDKEFVVSEFLPALATLLKPAPVAAMKKLTLKKKVAPPLKVKAKPAPKRRSATR